MSRVFVCALAATTLLSCAEGPRSAQDPACDPRAPVCPAGTECRVVEGGGVCLAQSPPPADAACDAASCAPGEACLVVEGLLGCHPLCDPEADAPGCPEDALCGYVLADLGLGICPTACAAGQPCGPGGTCSTTPSLPYPTCVAIGDAAEGEPCEDARCGAGLACLTGGDAPRCARLCTPGAAECPSGQCTGEIVGVDGVGYCADDS